MVRNHCVTSFVRTDKERPETRVYATYSEGFRRGGANALPTSGGYASLRAAP